MSLRLITPPASEPVTREQAKNHLRVDIDEDDTLISSLIVVARQRAEEFTRRAFITQTWEWTLFDYNIPRRSVTLRSQGQQIDQVTLDGVEMSATQYKLISDDIVFDPMVKGVFTIRYTAGYGDNADDVPEQIKQAILQIVGHLYENRESQGIPPLAEDLLSLYKVWMI
jgi:uncharacterized phiE125 gp8 family phage protein